MPFCRNRDTLQDLLNNVSRSLKIQCTSDPDPHFLQIPHSSMSGQIMECCEGTEIEASMRGEFMNGAKVVLVRNHATIPGFKSNLTPEILRSRDCIKRVMQNYPADVKLHSHKINFEVI